ncbi:MAG TPA: NF038129 family PEP-CTERM protein [Candidatus Acidoferrum sp.]
MKTNLKRRLSITLAALLLTLLTQATAHADSVTVDTTSLQGNASGPFELAFVLIDASLSGDGNNTVTLSDFTFGGGAAGATATSGGGATGNLLTGITLTDTDLSGLNFLTSAFTPGSTLSFNLAMTANLDSKIDPALGNVTGDQLLFFILDSTGNPIHSTDTSAPDAFAIATVGPGGVTVQQFSVPAQTSVPEPGTLLLVGSGMALGLFRRKRVQVNCFRTRAAKT